MSKRRPMILVVAAILVALVSFLISVLLVVPYSSNGWQRMHFWLPIICASASFLIAYRERTSPVAISLYLSLFITALVIVLGLVWLPYYWPLIGILSLAVAVPATVALTFLGNHFWRRGNGP